MTPDELRRLFDEAQEIADEISPEEVPPPDLPDDQVLPFPVDALPQVARRYALEAAESLRCPVDYLGGGVLAAMSGGVGLSRELVIKDDWREPAAIWLGLRGHTGDKKTPAIKKFLAPVFRKQEELKGAHGEALAAWGHEHRKWQGEMAAWQRAGRKEGEEPPPEPPRPKMKQILVDDVTIEALADVMNANPRGVLLYRDELAGWVKDMSRYSQTGISGERQRFLSMWSGAPIIVNRRNRPDPVVIPRPFLAVCGGLPPDLLTDLDDVRQHQDGFIERFLFVAPPRHKGGYSDHVIDASVRDDYYRMIHRLFDLTYDQVTASGSPDPRPVFMTPKAKTLFRRWHEAHDAILADPDLPPILRGYEAKMPTHLARLALLIHLGRLVTGETKDLHLTSKSLSMAIKLADYFRSTARLVFGELEASRRPGERRIVQAVRWIREKDPDGQGVTVRDVLRARVAGCQTRGDVEKLFRDLTDRGYGETRPEHRGGWKTLRFTLRRRHDDGRPDGDDPPEGGAHQAAGHPDPTPTDPAAQGVAVSSKVSTGHSTPLNRVVKPEPTKVSSVELGVYPSLDGHRHHKPQGVVSLFTAPDTRHSTPWPERRAVTGHKGVEWEEGVDSTPDIFGADSKPGEQAPPPRIPTRKTHIEADPSENEVASPSAAGKTTENARSTPSKTPNRPGMRSGLPDFPWSDGETVRIGPGSRMPPPQLLEGVPLPDGRCPGCGGSLRVWSKAVQKWRCAWCQP